LVSPLILVFLEFQKFSCYQYIAPLNSKALQDHLIE